jgi:hypothetical protein
MLKTVFLAALLWLVQFAVNFLFALVCADWFWHVHSGFGLSILALSLSLSLSLAYWLWLRHICHGKNVLAMTQAYWLEPGFSGDSLALLKILNFLAS